MVEVLEAVERGEVIAGPGPVWWRGAVWWHHRAPSRTLESLRARMLVDAGLPGVDGWRRPELTGDGRRALKGVRRGRVDA